MLLKRKRLGGSKYLFKRIPYPIFIKCEFCDTKIKLRCALGLRLLLHSICEGINSGLKQYKYVAEKEI